MFDDESYYSFKLCEMLLAESNLKDWVYNNPVINTSHFLVLFSEFINTMIKNDFISPIMKNNALTYLNLVRFNNDKEIDKIDDVPKKIRIILTNDMIRKINIQKGENYLIYYRQEMYKRTCDKDYLTTPFDDFIIQYESILLNSIQFDQYVLLSHSDSISEEDFENDFLPELSSDLRYFNTINCILEEYPHQFLNQLFLKRYLKTIDSFLKFQDNNLNNSSIIDFNNKVICKTIGLMQKF